MGNLFKIAIRNLLRYKRRTLLTASLITIGVVFVLGYISIAGSFKNMMIAQITDSSLGHLQVHRTGYMAAVESLTAEHESEDKAIQDPGGYPQEPSPRSKPIRRESGLGECSAHSWRQPAFD